MLSSEVHYLPSTGNYSYESYANESNQWTRQGDSSPWTRQCYSKPRTTRQGYSRPRTTRQRNSRPRTTRQGNCSTRTRATARGQGRATAARGWGRARGDSSPRIIHPLGAHQKWVCNWLWFICVPSRWCWSPGKKRRRNKRRRRLKFLLTCLTLCLRSWWTNAAQQKIQVLTGEIRLLREHLLNDHHLVTPSSPSFTFHLLHSRTSQRRSCSWGARRRRQWNGTRQW